MRFLKRIFMRHVCSSRKYYLRVLSFADVPAKRTNRDHRRSCNCFGAYAGQPIRLDQQSKFRKRRDTILGCRWMSLQQVEAGIK